MLPKSQVAYFICLSGRYSCICRRRAKNSAPRRVTSDTDSTLQSKEVFMLNGKKVYRFIRKALSVSCAVLILCSCAGNSGNDKTAADVSVSAHTEAGKALAEDSAKAAGQAEQGDRDEKKDVQSSGKSEISDGAAGKSDVKKDAEKDEKKNAQDFSQVSLTEGQANALRKAKEYLNYDAFSAKGLTKQLVYNGFSEEDAAYAVEHCEADWNEQAAYKAKSYLEYSAFSKDGLVDQLVYEGFTLEQAEYGVANSGIDTGEQAKDAAISFLKYTPYSYSGLVDMLKYQGYSEEESVAAVEACGADWNEQAARSAESYLKYMSFSKEELVDQLMFDGFTEEQAEYGANSVCTD